MLTIKEFKLDLSGTPEEQEMVRETQGKSGISCIIEMPHFHTIRRINTRIVQHRRTGLHPHTKEMGTFIEPEECVYLWAECESDDREYPFKFKIIPTGGEVPALPYVGTFLLQAGSLVFHVYGPIHVMEKDNG